MEKEDENYSEAAGEPEGVMVDYTSAVDRALSFADVMQFADFGPKLGLHQAHQHGHESSIDGFNCRGGDPGGAIDAVNFVKFPVLNEHPQLMYTNNANMYSNPVQLEFMGSGAGNSAEENANIVETKIGGAELEGGGVPAGKHGAGTKRKRPRTVKTSEEVESQRMTHIAVERNRRKQMNEHLRVLRSLMPSSYVQRGDQASIIGGAIEFVRELEQLLQCLDSQKRRRLYGDQGGPSSSSQQPLGFPPQMATPGQYQEDQLRLVEMDPTNCTTGLLWEDSSESKSSIADVEVKMSGFNALIKILSRRRPGQLIKIIADLEELHFAILHTNITTIEQTVLYSFHVQVASEAQFTAEDIANSVQQIFTFIHANTNII